MRPFLSRCAGCNKVDYRFAIGVHCTDCKRVIKAFFWYGTSWADVKRRCLELGLSFYKVFGSLFQITDFSKEAPVIDIMKRITEQIALEMDREILQELRKASNW